MRFDRLSIAAWTLSLAIEPDRATTAVGDFSEESATHERTWFWQQIVRTLGAHVVRDLVDVPRPLFRGLRAGFGLFVSLFVALIVSLVVMRTGFVLYSPGMNLHALGVNLLAEFYVLATLVASGRRMARVSNHALAACLLFFAVCTLLWGVLAAAEQRLPDYPYKLFFPVLLGAVWERRRALKVA
jgi:hypothetical protein